jgi:hypothetical protein
MINLDSLREPAHRWFKETKKIKLGLFVVAGVLLLAALLTPRIISGTRIPTLLFLLYLFVLASIVFLRWPVLGLIAAFLGGAFVPAFGPGNLNLAQAGVGLILVLWILKMIVEQRKIQLIVSRTTKPLFVFLLVSFLSFGMGQLPWFLQARSAPLDTQLAGLSIFVLSAGAFLFVAHQVQDLKWLKALTWIFIGLGAFYVIGRMMPIGFLDRLFQRGFRSGSMFWTWLVALSFGQAFLNQRLPIRWRIVLGGIVLTAFYIAYFQAGDWKSGWIPPLVAIATIIGFRYFRPAIVLIPFALVPIYNFAISIINTDLYSWVTRLEAWRILIEIVKINPILGLGFGTYYWITPLFPILGWNVSFNSHSQYLDILAQTGILGLACFLWFVWEVGRLGWRLRDRVPDGFPRAYVYSALGGLAGTLVAATLVDWILPFVYNIGLAGFRASILAWIFMGGLVSLNHIYRENNE